MDNAFKQLLEFGPFRLDPEQRLLLRDQRPVPLSPKAFELLLILLQRSGEVVLKDDLMKLLWPNTFVEESNLGQHVFQIRKALGEKSQGSYIVTVPGRGYQFAQRVRFLPREDEDIVVESHVRSRVLIEGQAAGVGTDASPSPLRAGDFRTLPPASTKKWHRSPITVVALGALVLVGAASLAVFLPSPTPSVARSVQLTRLGRVEPFSQALTDGPRVFFAERLGGTRTLAQVPESGGDASPIPTSVDNIAIHDIDRRRSQLLVTSEKTGSDYPLWIVPTGGGSGQRVSDLVAHSAAWSPEQHLIVYSRGADLFAARDDGSQPKKLFSGPGIVEYLRLSPAGEHVSFTVRNFATSTLSLWEIGADGSNPHPVTFGWNAPISRWGEGECCGDWSPNGKYFIFRSRRDRIASVWIVSQEKSLFRTADAPVQLYTSPDRLNQPRFSADGKKIFLVHYHERLELARYDPQKQTFIPYLGGIPARLLSYSHDGQWVAYKNEPDGSLWRSRVDGTDARQLTFPPLDIYHPTWSPDGRQIAFDVGLNLYVVPSNGGTPQALLPQGEYGMQPHWSPDGKSLVFTRWPPGQSPSLYTFDLATRQSRLIPGSENLECPRWSPDGRYLAATANENQNVMLFDLGRQTWSQLVSGPSYAWGLRWSSDSKYVYYQRISGGEDQPVFRVRISDRMIEQVTSSKQILSADVLSYSLTGLTPDDSPVVSFLHRNSDIYSLELNLP